MCQVFKKCLLEYQLVIGFKHKRNEMPYVDKILFSLHIKISIADVLTFGTWAFLVCIFAAHRAVESRALQASSQPSECALAFATHLVGDGRVMKSES